MVLATQDPGAKAKFNEIQAKRAAQISAEIEALEAVFAAGDYLTDGEFTHVDSNCPLAAGRPLTRVGSWAERGAMVCFSCVDSDDAIFGGASLEIASKVEVQQALRNGGDTAVVAKAKKAKTRLASPGQVRFVLSLISQVEALGATPILPRTEVERDGVVVLDSAMASSMIDQLKFQIAEAAEAANPAEKLDRIKAMASGEWSVDGEIVQVDKPDRGNWAGSIFIKDANGDRIAAYFAESGDLRVVNQAALDALLDKGTQEAKPEPESQATDLDLGAGMYDALVVRFAYQGKRYKISTTRSGPNKGVRYLATGSEYNDNALLGRQRPGQGFQPERRSERGQEVAEAFLADPVARMREYAEITSECGRCGRLLEDDASVEAGFGPHCLSKMGI